MAIVVERLTGVYDADGSLIGELRYVLGKLLGSAHCALCDISHRGVREKSEFRQCRSELPVPFEVVHLDERSDEIARLTAGRTPCVVAHTSEGALILLDAERLEACEGEVGAFRGALDEAMTERGLVFRGP